MVTRKNVGLVIAIAAAIMLLLLWPHSAKAETPDLQIYAGANSVWLDGPGAQFPVDVEAAGSLSSSLTPHITLTGGLYYGFANSYIRGDGGVRITATDAQNPNMDISLGLEYRGGSIAAVQPSEWAPYAIIGWRPNHDRWPGVTLGAKSSLGLTSDRTVSTIWARYALPFNLLK